MGSQAPPGAAAEVEADLVKVSAEISEPSTIAKLWPLLSQLAIPLQVRGRRL